MRNHLKLVFNSCSLDLQDVAFERLDALPVFESVLKFSVFILQRKFYGTQAIKDFAKLRSLLDVGLENILLF